MVETEDTKNRDLAFLLIGVLIGILGSIWVELFLRFFTMTRSEEAIALIIMTAIFWGLIWYLSSKITIKK